MNKFSYPFGHWEEPAFSSRNDKTSFVDKSKSKIQYSKVISVVNQASLYFAPISSDATKIRLRKPSETVCKPESYIESYNDGVIESLNKAYTIVISSVQSASLRLDSLYFREGNFKEVIHTNEPFQREQKCISLIAMYNYIAAVCLDSEKEESRAFRSCEKINVPRTDIAHFFHLIDEMLSIKSYRDLTMLRLILGDISPFVRAFESQPHILPNLYFERQIITRVRDFPINRHYSTRNEYVALEKFEVPSINALNEIHAPELIPATSTLCNLMGNIPSDITIITQSLLDEKYTETLQFCSSYLANEKPKAEIYLIRAYALIKLRHLSDAILDLNKALHIKKSDEALRARAAVWLMMHQYKQAYDDLKNNEVMDDIMDIIQALEQNNFHCKLLA